MSEIAQPEPPAYLSSTHTARPPAASWHIEAAVVVGHTCLLLYCAVTLASGCGRSRTLGFSDDGYSTLGLLGDLANVMLFGGSGALGHEYDDCHRHSVGANGGRQTGTPTHTSINHQ